MKEILALIAYGLLLLSGMFMTVFWGRVAIRRIREITGHPWYDDKYFMISSCLCLAAIGTSMFFAGRAYQFMHAGLSTVSQPNLVSLLILIGLFILAVAKAGFVWAVHCSTQSWVWRTFLFLSGFWILAAILWGVVDPVNTYPFGG